MKKFTQSELETVDFEDLTKINVPWAFLGDCTKDRMFELIGDGEAEILTHSYGVTRWEPKVWGAKFKPVNVYRQKPEPLTKPSIDWSYVAPKWKWLARDDDGCCYLYPTKPRLMRSFWLKTAVINPDYTPTYLYARACGWPPDHALTKLDAGTCDWKDSLVERPE